MTEQQVDDVLTHANPTEVYASLRSAWRGLVGTEPGRRSLLVLLAHWHFETGGGGAMHCFNIGNIKHTTGDGRSYCVFLASEILHGVEQFFDMPFRAYQTLDDGVEDYMKLLRGQFGFAWPAVESGDCADFAHRLKRRGYYTADEEVYTRGIRGRYALLDATIPPDTLPDITVETSDPESAA